MRAGGRVCSHDLRGGGRGRSVHTCRPVWGWLFFGLRPGHRRRGEWPDGLERDSLDRLAAEMDRLHRGCRRLIWLNPLLRFDGFEAKARGIRAMLPHVDEFRAAHSLEAVADVVRALGAGAVKRADPRRDLAVAWGG